MIVDCKGIELQVGDIVIFTYKSAGRLSEGIINRLRKSDCIVEQQGTDWKGNPHTYYCEIRSPSTQIYKI